MKALLEQALVQALQEQALVQALQEQAPVQALQEQALVQALLWKVQKGKGQEPGTAPSSSRDFAAGHVAEWTCGIHRHCPRVPRPRDFSVPWVEELPRVEALARKLFRWLGCEKGRLWVVFVFAAWEAASVGGCRGAACAGSPSSSPQKL